MPLKLTTQDIINRFRGKHGDKYDYSKVAYTGIFNKVTIICPVHGEFTQSAKKHGDGCPKCGLVNQGLSRRGSQESFISRAKEVHGERYDYSKTVYKRTCDNLTITCRLHGDFEQKPLSHIKGHGCPVCAKIATGNHQRSDRDTFIAKAREVHGDKYDYSKVAYVSCKEKVTIICPIHGEFEQIASDHIINGSGCPKCGQAIVNQKLTKTNDFFIAKAREVHGDKYDYSKVDYQGNDKHITIICPIHGEFEQLPSNHYKGCGCEKCTDTHGGEGFVYVLATKTMVKIGKVKNNRQYNVEQRINRIFKSQRKQAPEFIEGGLFQLMDLYKFGDGSFIEAGRNERKAHSHFKQNHCNHLPCFDGYNEFFTAEPEDVCKYLELIGGKKAG